MCTVSEDMLAERGHAIVICILLLWVSPCLLECLLDPKGHEHSLPIGAGRIVVNGDQRILLLGCYNDLMTWNRESLPDFLNNGH